MRPSNLLHSLVGLSLCPIVFCQNVAGLNYQTPQPVNAKRSNFASLDCAAAIMDSTPGCKGADNILSEDKDSYMISECSLKDKYVVVKLCLDILVDNVVLTNYEYFSSMFKNVRISVADRYPTNDWTVIGDYIAEGYRGEHSFTIDSPKLWASYLKVEFLSHWGNEFYCPINVLKVYGTTMMDQYKNQPQEPQFDLLGEVSDRVGMLEQEQYMSVQPCNGDDDIYFFDDLPYYDGLFAGSVSASCPADKPTLLGQGSEYVPPHRAVCKVPKQILSPLLPPLCCPPALVPAPPKVEVKPVVSFQESLYENIMKRIGVLETSAALLKTLYDKSVETQAMALETIFDALNATITADIDELVEENLRLQSALGAIEIELSYHRTTLIVQTIIVAVLLLLIFYKISTPPIGYSGHAGNQPGLQNGQREIYFEPKHHHYPSGSEEEIFDKTLSGITLETENDVYSPDPSIFTPSRPSTPIIPSQEEGKTPTISQIPAV